MNRSLSVIVSTIVGSALLLTISSVAFAATPGASLKDTTPPSDVNKLTAEVGNQMVKLTWDSAKDNVGVTAYKIYSGPYEVTSKNKAKYAENKNVGNVTTYEIDGLKNGATYYMSVTALDAAGNESASYSPYVMIQPESKIVASTTVSPTTTTSTTSTTTSISKPAGAPSTVAAIGGPAANAPTVISAVAVYKDQVKVIFSEAVKLPSNKPETAFTVQDNLTYEYLKVKDAFLDPTDATNKTVILDTADQIPNSEYIVTAGIGVEDLAGNPISSGNNDFGKFTGSALTLEEYLKAHPADTKDISPKIVTSITGPVAAASDVLKLMKVEVVNSTSLKVTFSQPGVFDLDPTKNFSITKKSDSKTVLPIMIIVVSDSKDVVTITSAMELDTAYTLQVTGVMDSKGTEITKDNGMFDFSSTIGVKDVTPPEDVTNFVAQAVAKMAATMNWKASKNSAGDLLQYIIYKSEDGKSYGQLTTLSKENTGFSVPELQPGYHYFKITAKDATGNESTGKIAKVRIVQTGPEMGLVALASVGLGRVFGKRKAKASKK